MWYSQIAYKNEQLLYKKFFDQMFSLESDKMTALWPNDSPNFTFYVPFSNRMPNWASFKKEVFKFSLERDEMTAMWPNESLTSTFLQHSQIA